MNTYIIMNPVLGCLFVDADDVSMAYEYADIEELYKTYGDNKIYTANVIYGNIAPLTIVEALDVIKKYDAQNDPIKTNFRICYNRDKNNVIIELFKFPMTLALTNGSHTTSWWLPIKSEV